jgi:hypothetical protein
VDVINKTPARRFVRFALAAVGMVPVHQRIIKADAQAFSARCLHIFFDEIAARPLFRGAVISQLRIEIAEAFMV